MPQYFRVKRLRIFGAPLYLHWSVFLVVGICILNGIKQPLSAFLSVCAYFSVLLIHESGHALAVRHYGYRVYEIRLAFIHGVCIHDGNLSSKWHEVAIAWAGVLAQFSVVLLVMLMSIVPEIDHIASIEPIFVFLGPINLVIAIFNLVPVAPLDGAKAWRVIPLLFERWRPRPGKKKPKRSPLRSVK